MLRLTKYVAGITTAVTLAIAFPCFAQTAKSPWVCYGQTKVGNTSADDWIQNPKPNTNGLVGECGNLPYTVPAGYELHLEAYGVEGYPAAPDGSVNGCIVIVPMIGSSWNGTDNSQALHSVNAGAGAGTRSTSGLSYVLPTGMTLTVVLETGCGDTTDGYVYGWFLSGHLVSTTAAGFTNGTPTRQ